MVRMDSFMSDMSSVMDMQFGISKLLGTYHVALRRNRPCKFRVTSYHESVNLYWHNLFSYSFYAFACLQDAPRAIWKAYCVSHAVCYQTITTTPSTRTTIGASVTAIAADTNSVNWIDYYRVESTASCACTFTRYMSPGHIGNRNKPSNLLCLMNNRSIQSVLLHASLETRWPHSTSSVVL
jgi:hypothetical protein